MKVSFSVVPELSAHALITQHTCYGRPAFSESEAVDQVPYFSASQMTPMFRQVNQLSYIIQKAMLNTV